MPEVAEVYIWLLSQIGKTIDRPAVAAAQIVMKPEASIEEFQKDIWEVINFELENIDKFCMDLVHGKIKRSISDKMPYKPQKKVNFIPLTSIIVSEH